MPYRPEDIFNPAEFYGIRGHFLSLRREFLHPAFSCATFWYSGSGPSFLIFRNSFVVSFLPQYPQCCRGPLQIFCKSFALKKSMQHSFIVFEMVILYTEILPRHSAFLILPRCRLSIPRTSQFFPFSFT
jgi:hypothetical protein